MVQRNADEPSAHLSVVCPTCQGVLKVAEVDDVEPGDAIRAFCPDCARNVEVTAPAGVTAGDNGTVDRVDASLVSEFPAPRASDPH